MYHTSGPKHIYAREHKLYCFITSDGSALVLKAKASKKRTARIVLQPIGCLKLYVAPEKAYFKMSRQQRANRDFQEDCDIL